MFFRKYFTLILVSLGGALFAEESRAPWTASAVIGSPEPPLPYAAEPFWPEITFQKACDIAHFPEREVILVTEQGGKIWVLPDDIDTSNPEKRLFADFKESHDPFNSVFSLCFHPQYEKNREVFVFYRINFKGESDGTRISRFTTFEDRFELNPASEEILLTFRSGGHNGGHLGFGPDGMLYVLAGDSEVPSPPDPLKTGQDITDLLSSVLRIDVDRRDKGKTYAIPEDNPFLDVPKARPEVWAYGLRNPWKLCFHPETGDLWVGDVGWELWEMIYRVERGSNFGWSIVEAVQPILPNQNPGPSSISSAAVMHPHTEFASITGGYFYEGERLPGLRGVYLYGDFVTGQLWGMWHDGSEVVKKEFLADTRKQIVSFGKAAKGEVIFIDWQFNQHLHRLVENPAPDLSGDFPKSLSETGIFSDTKAQVPAAGVYSYEINGSMWHDGASAKRWIAIPGEGTIVAKERSLFAKVPSNTVLAKTITRDEHNLETQLLYFDGTAWQGYSYRWNEDQTDATLVSAAGETATIAEKPWTFHSRADCVRCHSIASDYRLSFHPGQMNRDGQLERFRELGLINDAFVSKQEKQPSALVSDLDAPIELRARTWLSANCAHCHRNRGGGSVTIKMDLETPFEKMDLLNAVPEKGGFGILDPLLVAPGEPQRSILYYRSVTPGIGHMPMIGAKTVDPTGVSVLYDWIASMEKKKSLDPRVDAPGVEVLSTETIEAALRAVYLIRGGDVTAAKSAELIKAGKASANPMISGLFQGLEAE